MSLPSKNKGKTPLGDQEDVARHLPKRLIIWDRKDRTKTLGCFPDAFRLRKERNEKYLSAAKPNHYDGNIAEQVSEIAKAMIESGYELRAGSGFTVGNVGKIKACCQTPQVEMLSVPKSGRPAYVEVWNIPQEDDDLLARLGLEDWSTIITADSLKTK